MVNSVVSVSIVIAIQQKGRQIYKDLRSLVYSIYLYYFT